MASADGTVSDTDTDADDTGAEYTQDGFSTNLSEEDIAAYADNTDILGTGEVAEVPEDEEVDVSEVPAQYLDPQTDQNVEIASAGGYGFGIIGLAPGEEMLYVTDAR